MKGCSDKRLEANAQWVLEYQDQKAQQPVQIPAIHESSDIFVPQHSTSSFDQNIKDTLSQLTKILHTKTSRPLTRKQQISLTNLKFYFNFHSHTIADGSSDFLADRNPCLQYLGVLLALYNRKHRHESFKSNKILLTWFWEIFWM
jgi:hypothetical protein